MSSFTTNPGYLDLVVDLYKSMTWFYRPQNWGNYTFPQSFFDDFKKYYYFPVNDYFLIVCIGIVITVIRYLFEMFICKPIMTAINLDGKSNRNKFPESAWKLTIYSILWFYCSYLLIFSGKYDYFTHSWQIWDDWEIGMQIPDDIRVIYFIECGFYLHSIYATLFMDTWRKDSIVMLIHHVLTMTLIVVSYATRYHKIGLLVLFVHDVTDILLEFTKLNVYLKNRNGKIYMIHEHISNIGFGIFTLAWYLFRLYWFPLKILYSTGVVAVHRAYFRGAGLYAFFNSLLWFLLVLDIYWFYYILLFLYKVATGQAKAVEDTRDFDDETTTSNKKKGTINGKKKVVDNKKSS